METPSANKPKPLQTMPSPAGAWARSLPGVLIGPLFGWLALCLYGLSQEASSGLDAALYYSVVFWLAGMLVHFPCCLLVVFPVFMSQYQNSQSPLWNPFVALVFGGGLGYAAFALLVLATSGGEFEPLPPLVGAAYGVWTAIWSLRTKPKFQEDES